LRERCSRSRASQGRELFARYAHRNCRGRGRKLCASGTPKAMQRGPKKVCSAWRAHLQHLEDGEVNLLRFCTRFVGIEYFFRVEQKDNEKGRSRRYIANSVWAPKHRAERARGNDGCIFSPVPSNSARCSALYSDGVRSLISEFASESMFDGKCGAALGNCGPI